MTDTLSSILNWAVPLGVILIFFALMYTKMKEPLDTLFKWIKNAFSYVVDSLEGSGTVKKEIGYQ